jgi:hypothetical protein
MDMVLCLVTITNKTKLEIPVHECEHMVMGCSLQEENLTKPAFVVLRTPLPPEAKFIPLLNVALGCKYGGAKGNANA